MSYLTGISSIINAALLSGGKALSGEAACIDVQIRGNYTIFQADSIEYKGVINATFTPGPQRRICDYIIVSDTVVLVCELKSNNEGHMKSQLRNTGRLVKYLLEMVKEHNSIIYPIPPIKYVCFAKRYSNIKQKAMVNKLTSMPWFDSELFQLPCSSIYHLKQFN